MRWRVAGYALVGLIFGAGFGVASALVVAGSPPLDADAHLRALYVGALYAGAINCAAAFGLMGSAAGGVLGWWTGRRRAVAR